MNIHDIAKNAGVSISTVSRVINNGCHVSQEKRDRVNSIINQSNYVPSAIAKSLVVKSTNTIGVLAPDIRYSHYANIAYTIERSLSRDGYTVILSNTGEEQTWHEKYIRGLAEKQVDGVIMLGSIFSSELVLACVDRYLQRSPVVMYNGRIKRKNIYSIISNETLGMETALKYLLRKGIREIVFVKEYDTWITRDKQKIFRDMITSMGLPYSIDHIVHVPRGLNGGTMAVEIVNEKGLKCEAYIGSDDITAVGIIKKLISEGKRVPEDVAVIGFNDSNYGEASCPQLTVIDSKCEAVGLALARMLVDVFYGVDVPAETTLTPTLIVRGSA